MIDSYFEKDKTFCTSESCCFCPPLYWKEVVCLDTSFDETSMLAGCSFLRLSASKSCKLFVADLECLEVLLPNLLVGDIDCIDELWLELRPLSGERSFVIMLNLFLNEIGAYEWTD